VRALIALLFLATSAGATPKQDLDQANDRFRKGDFENARHLYNDLLYPSPQLAGADDLAEAYVGLGVCRLETGDSEGARREFEKALQIDPNKQLDPQVMSKSAIRLFDDTKADLRTRAERDAEKKKQAELLEAQQKYIDSLRVYQAHPYWMNWIPPLGQFQNDDTFKGVLFASGELATAGTSIAIWGYLVNKYGIRSDKVPLQEGPTVLLLQQVEIGAGLAFFGLYVLGVIDAHRHYTPATLIKGDKSLLPPQLQTPAKPKKTSLLERIHMLPMVTPTSAGIGIGWEN